MVKLRNYARTDDLETAGSVQFRYNKINIPEKTEFCCLRLTEFRFISSLK